MFEYVYKYYPPPKDYEYEYCVMRDGDDEEPHRGPMSKEEACRWVREWERGERRRKEKSEGMFYVACRPTGPWQRVDE